MKKFNNVFVIGIIIILVVGCSLPLDVFTDDAFGKANSIVYRMDLCQYELDLYEGDSQLLSVSLTPEADPGKRLVWSSDNPEVAKVDKGQVTAITEGIATITASITGTDLTASVLVTVRCGKVAELTINHSNLSLLMGESNALLVSIFPEDALDKEVTWSSNNSSVVEVCQYGTVTAKTPGTAVITVTSRDGGASASCTVTVSPISVSGVSLDTSFLSLTLGNTRQLTATVSPQNACQQNLTWSSSNPGVASVSSAGLVTAKGGGSTVITVTTKDGQKTATCKVTVKVPVTGVTLNTSSLTNHHGWKALLIPTIQPVNATDKTVTWASANSTVASVSNSGLVTFHKPGTTTITVTTVDGKKTAQSTITVTLLQGTPEYLETAMVSLVNNERKLVGRAPLAVDSALRDVARIKSQDMIDNDYFDHTSPTYGCPFEMMQYFDIKYTWAGENIAYNSCVADAHRRLMDSPGHRENILRPEFTHIGLGIKQNSYGQYYITQMFIGK